MRFLKQYLQALLISLFLLSNPAHRPPAFSIEKLRARTALDFLVIFESAQK